jgi:hypothetical protein
MSFDRGSSLTVPHLCCSFRLGPEYGDFRNELERFLPLLGLPAHPSTGDPRIDAVLRVIRIARAKEKVDGRDEMKGSAGSSATKQDDDMYEDDNVDEDDNMDEDENLDHNGAMAEAHQPQAPVDDALRIANALELENALEQAKALKTGDTLKTDDALDILLRNATEEFGFAPRDVYSGVFDLPRTTEEHTIAVEQLERSDLLAIVQTFFMTYRLDTLSCNVVAVYPYKPAEQSDRWAINFKSNRIVGKVVEMMELEAGRHLRGMFDLLCDDPEGASLAERIFVTAIHRILSRGWRSDGGPMPRPIRMVSNNKPLKPPTFSTASSPSSSASGASLTSSDTPQSSPTPPHAGARTTPQPIRTVSHYHGPHTSMGSSSLSSTPGASLPSSKPRVVTTVNFTNLSNVTFDEDRYYILESATNPLFDSFIINLVEPQTVVISVFRITVSRKHRGSAEGYPLIRKIMTHLKGSKPEAKVRVEYFLVCLDRRDGSEYQWQMPAGWDKNFKIHDHRGEAFCIRIPISERYGMSRLFTSNFAAQLNHDLM